VIDGYVAAKGKDMLKNRELFVFLAVAFIVFGFHAVSAQRIVVRAMGGGGYTLVNFKKASGYPDSSLEDWNQVNYSLALQGLWKLAPNIRIGGEAGWEQLYYWYYIIPYGYSPVYREANWATVFVGGVAQFFLTPIFYALGGVDLHFFSGDGTALGVSGGIGMEIPLFDRLAIPIEFRVKPVFGAGTPTVFQINIGAALSTGR
jgi:hypothetical protein